MERASDSLSGWVRRAGPSLPVERYLAELDAVLEGQADTSLAVDGIDAPLSGVARAVIVESIGADLEAAARDLMLAGVPRSQAEMRAISDLGPAPDLGRACSGPGVGRRSWRWRCPTILGHGRSHSCKSYCWWWQSGWAHSLRSSP